MCPTPSWCNAGGLTQGPRHARRAVYLPVEYLYSLTLNTVLFGYFYCLDMQMQSLYVLWDDGKGQGLLRVCKLCCFHCRGENGPNLPWQCSLYGNSEKRLSANPHFVLRFLLAFFPSWSLSSVIQQMPCHILLRHSIGLSPEALSVNHTKASL